MRHTVKTVTCYADCESKFEIEAERQVRSSDAGRFRGRCGASARPGCSRESRHETRRTAGNGYRSCESCRRNQSCRTTGSPSRDGCPAAGSEQDRQFDLQSPQKLPRRNVAGTCREHQTVGRTAAYLRASEGRGLRDRLRRASLLGCRHGESEIHSGPGAGSVGRRGRGCRHHGEPAARGRAAARGGRRLQAGLAIGTAYDREPRGQVRQVGSLHPLASEIVRTDRRFGRDARQGGYLSGRRYGDRQISGRHPAGGLRRSFRRGVLQLVEDGADQGDRPASLRALHDQAGKLQLR